MLKPIRQGDVLLLPTEDLEGIRLSNIMLAKGEVKFYKHKVTDGQVELYAKSGSSFQNPILFLCVLSETATLIHEKHRPIQLPQGAWIVRTQRHYQPAPLSKLDSSPE